MSLYANINKRKKAGTSRSKKDSTISPEAYKNMQKGFPKAEAGMKLNKRQKETMKRHKEHHTDEHMKIMTEEMLNGATFEEAHEIALEKVGK